jgi:hypothetical protein
MAKRDKVFLANLVEAGAGADPQAPFVVDDQGLDEIICQSVGGVKRAEAALPELEETFTDRPGPNTFIRGSRR